MYLIFKDEVVCSLFLVKIKSDYYIKTKILSKNFCFIGLKELIICINVEKREGSDITNPSFFFLVFKGAL